MKVGIPTSVMVIRARERRHQCESVVLGIAGECFGTGDEAFKTAIAEAEPEIPLDLKSQSVVTEIWAEAGRFVEEVFQPKIAPNVKTKSVKVGRNEACPCGSGRTFRKSDIGAPPDRTSVSVDYKMTNKELVEALVEYGNKHYPAIEVSRKVEDSTDGIGFKDFIESLSYQNERRDQIAVASPEPLSTQ